MYLPLADYLSRRLGHTKVTVVTAKDFETFWKGVLKQKQYDIVHYNQYHYIRSAQNYRVIAHSQEFGRSAVAGAVFVRKDSGITDLSQLKGRRVIFGGGKDAMLSYIAPTISDDARRPEAESDYKTEFAVNPPNALLALYHRQADAAGGGDILIDLPVVRNAIDTGELKILADDRASAVPAMGRETHDAGEALRESIQSILIELDNSDAGKSALKAAKTTRIEQGRGQGLRAPSKNDRCGVRTPMESSEIEAASR